MMQDDDDAVGLLLQLLDDLLIYKPGTILEYAGKKPTREDLESIQNDTTVKILRILRRYVRPRNEVLQIRRIVNQALQNGDVAEGNVFAEHAQVKDDIERLKVEKTELEERLGGVKRKQGGGDDARNTLLGNMFLQKAQKQVQILQIYQRHLDMLLNQHEEKVDSQTTLVSSPKSPSPNILTSLTVAVPHKSSGSTIIPRLLLPPRLLHPLRIRPPPKTHRSPPLPAHLLKTKTYSPVPCLSNHSHHAISPKKLSLAIKYLKNE